MKKNILGIIISTIIGIVIGAYLGKQKEAPTMDEDVKEDITELAQTEQADTLSEWQILKMAIAWTESRMNPRAIGKDEDWGILQITPIYVKEVNRVAGTTYSHEDAFSIEKSFEMFEAMQNAKNPEHMVERAIYYHNKSPKYRDRVLKNYELIKRYEQVRTTAGKM